MNAQYTIRNHRVPGCPVFIRTHSRAVAIRLGRGMLVTANCLDRARWGLATLEKRAAAVVQYDIFGKDKYH